MLLLLSFPWWTHVPLSFFFQLLDLLFLREELAKGDGDGRITLLACAGVWTGDRAGARLRSPRAAHLSKTERLDGGE